MISSPSPNDRAGRFPNSRATRQTLPRPLAPRPHATSATTSSVLRASAQCHSEIRPEVVARARALAADPNYPPMVIIRHVATRILAGVEVG